MEQGFKEKMANSTGMEQNLPGPTPYLFDIPIYWCSEASFISRYEKKLDTAIESEKKNLTGKGREYASSEDYRRLSHSILWEKSIGPWRFNQIVGWVRVFKDGDKLKGEYWSIKAKRFGWQLRKKPYVHQGKAFEIWPGDKESSEQIFSRMVERLRTFENELRGQVLDLESFKNLGQFVNWRLLVNIVAR